MDIKLRPSGIEEVGDMPWGTHFCMFYDTKEDLLNVLLRYFKAGLENHEFCLWVTPEPLSPEEANRAMREAGPEFERHLAEGQIEIVSYKDWYLVGGSLDTQRILQDWINKHDQAIANGYAGLRCTGNTFWLEKHQWDSFAKYETEIDKVLSQLQIIVLCTYPLERCSAADVLEVVHHHQFTVAKRNGIWEYLEGFELKRAHDEIRKMNAELEQRVKERTAELSAANEQLQQEVTERKQAEEALRRSEEKFKALFESAPVGISLLDRERKIVDMNPVLEQIMRINKEGLLAGSYRSRTYIRPDGTPKPVSEFASERALNENRPIYGVETGIVLEDGQLIWVQVNAVPLGLPDASVVVITQDITERKQAETAIRSLLQISEKLHATLDIDALLDSLVIEAMQLTDAEIGWSGLRTEEGMVCHTHITRDLQVIPFEYFWPPGIGLPGWVLAHKVPYVMNDAQSDKMIIPEIRERFGVKAAIDTRILDAQGEVIGFFEVINKKNGDRFSESDVEKLVAVSRIASIALQNAMSYANLERTEKALRESEEAIRQYATRMEALAEISRTFVEAGLDYQSVLNTVAQRTAQLIGDACVITLFSDDGNRSFPVAFYHPDPKTLAMMHDSFLHTWQGGTDTQRYQTLLSGNSIYIPMVNPEEFRASLEPAFLPYLDAIGISSVLIVPLQVQGRVIGTLGLTRDRYGSPYTRDDQVLLQDLADRAALTIQNAQLFEQVQSAQERLQALSHRLLEVQEAERRALTTELHDRIGQNLTALSINLQNTKALLLDEAAQVLATKFDDAQALVEHTTRQIRDIMAELHPPELEDYGLAAALETYAERAASRGNLELIADLPDLPPPPLPSDVLIALFRAAQEAITNVLKHADATRMEVSLEESDGRIRLRVEDDGRGFEPDAATEKEAQTWGLKIMRERIESIGGKVQIESEPGQGTQVVFEIERPS